MTNACIYSATLACNTKYTYTQRKKDFAAAHLTGAYSRAATMCLNPAQLLLDYFVFLLCLFVCLYLPQSIRHTRSPGISCVAASPRTNVEINKSM